MIFFYDFLVFLNDRFNTLIHNVYKYYFEFARFDERIIKFVIYTFEYLKRKRPCKPIENKVQEKLQELSENGEIEIKIQI